MGDCKSAKRSPVNDVTMDTYQKFKLTSAFILTFSVFAIIVIATITYIYTGSMVVAASISIFVILIRRYTLGGNLKKRKAVAMKIKIHFEKVDEEPLTDDKEWVKGVGLVDGVDQPMWVRFVKNGVIVFFLCFPREKPFLILWENIQNIYVFGVADEHEGTDQIAKITINDIGSELIIPWNSSAKSVIVKSQVIINRETK